MRPRKRKNTKTKEKKGGISAALYILLQNLPRMLCPARGLPAGFSIKKSPAESGGKKVRKTVHPPLKRRAEAVTPQVTPSKLPYGTRTNPLSAAISLS